MEAITKISSKAVDVFKVRSSINEAIINMA